MNGSSEEKEKQEAHLWRVVETRGWRKGRVPTVSSYCHEMCVKGLQIFFHRPEKSPSVQMGSICHRCQSAAIAAAAPESFWKVLKAWGVPGGQEGKMLDPTFSQQPQGSEPRGLSMPHFPFYDIGVTFRPLLYLEETGDVKRH